MSTVPLDTVTREQWLNSLVHLISDWYADLPEVRVSVGFTSQGSRSKRVGECWAPECDAEGRCQLFVHPGIADPIQVAAIIAHELIHAAIGTDKKHGPAFKAVAESIGLEGKMRSTVPGERFLETISPIMEKLGTYPHAALVPKKSDKKTQSTRMLKVECEECGYLLRGTKKWLEEALPYCPVCVPPMDHFAATMRLHAPEESEGA